MNHDIVISAKAPTSGRETFVKDSDGYYTVNLGGINVFNTRKEFYRHQNPDQLFSDPQGGNNLFYKRLTSGYLIGEANHPSYTKGMSNLDWYSRNIKLAIENAAFHIKEIILNPISGVAPIPDSGRPVRVLGKIKPSGKHGAGLESMLQNPNQNVAFSVRCITDNKVINGYVVKDVISIITYDWVDAPGIPECNKWSTIAREDNDLTLIKLDDLLNNKEFVKEAELALENDDEKQFHRDLVKKIKTITRHNNKSFLDRW